MTRATNLILFASVLAVGTGVIYITSTHDSRTTDQAAVVTTDDQHHTTQPSEDVHQHDHTSTAVDVTNAGMTHVSAEKIVISTAAIETLPVHPSAPGMGHAGHITVNSGQVVVPFDLWITGKTFNVSNAEFYNLHHANIFRPDVRSVTCEGIYWRDMLSIGSDTMYQNNFSLPDGHAVFVPAGAPLQLDVMFHNPETADAEDLHNVQGSIELTLAPADEVDSLTEAEYIRLELTDNPCSGDNDSFIFTVPANTNEYVIGQDYTANDPFVYTFSKPGRIVYAGGHVHGWEGGEKLDIFLNGQNILSYQTTKSSPHPYHYQTEHKEEDIVIEAGDVLRLEATYTNHSDDPISGAMGMFGMFFVAD